MNQDTENIAIAIDTTIKDKVMLFVGRNGEWQINTHDGRAQDVLEFLDLALQSNGCKISDISEIGVVMGGDSFTSTRVSAVIANALGFSCEISLKALPLDFVRQNNSNKWKYWSQAQSVEILTPQYSGEPNITIPK